MIRRYSSRKNKLDHSFLNERLDNAKSYDRIAGYFSSSILEIAGEAIENMEGKVQILCNSGLDVKDVQTAKAAQNSMRKEWCEFKPEELNTSSSASKRFERLYEFLKEGKIEVRVVPNEIFGLIHGKAGVITMNNGKKTAFIGSVNETYSGWKLNYELLWEDDSEESINWVQEEFDYFWNSNYAKSLSSFIIEDIKRISERTVIETLDDWKEHAEPASTIIESPVYRQELGLWDHQKYFVNLAFDCHKNYGGARFVLADMVGLGKTIQLAMSALLMAMYGDKPVLIIAPKTLIWQWQEEMKNLLDMPSALWNGKEWIDENGVVYPSNGVNSIKKCPRKVGIISQGLITSNSNSVFPLMNMEFECIIVDEAHRARRKNLGKGKEGHKPDPNNLMRFLMEISKKTKSMLLATATPVQLYPIEAWDLLNILAQGSDSVLGNRYSPWRMKPEIALKYIIGEDTLGLEDFEIWDWMRNPLPPTYENPRTFGRLRSQLKMSNTDYVIEGSVYHKMRKQEQARLGRIIKDKFLTEHNPFIRNIVRRTRTSLEKINPETGEPFLKPIKVKLFGENDMESIKLPSYLQDAYEQAELFCELLQKRVKGGGFIKTMILKRVGSSMIAGQNTAKKMLQNWVGVFNDEEDENSEEDFIETGDSEVKNLTEEEIECLQKFIYMLESNKGNDPKYEKVLHLLKKGIDGETDPWLDLGCIIFSQYYDSIEWLAYKLSKDLLSEPIGVYAGGDKSGIIIDGVYQRKTKEDIKQLVKQRKLRLLLGTDSASEGLNLQTLGTLINLDLPWNPTRLEQRKGRIQRIGQIRDEVYIYNMRYKDSVEDRVHALLSERLESIYGMFGQLPDVLEDVWIHVALNEIEEAQRKIDEVPTKHPFEIRYQDNVTKIDWESCTEVLNRDEKRKHLKMGWN